jgi:short/branched chain acyl-CoA dehydrogenase
MDEASHMDQEVIDGLFELGLMGIEIPEELGGSGLNFMSCCLTIEELAKVDPAVSVMCDVHSTVVCNTIRGYASDMLKEKYLPRLATNMMGSFCLSEAGSGSDAFALTTTAKPNADGSDYTINGQKMWITNAEVR